MPLLFELFLTFFKVGLFTFGGGYAMIPVVQAEVVPKWLTEDMFMNFIAVAESTPGPIAVNMATFIGSSQAGFWGAVLSTLGVVLPSFIIILLIAALITGLMKFAGVKAFLSGIRPVIVGLMIVTGITLLLTVVIGANSIGQTIDFDWKKRTSKPEFSPIGNMQSAKQSKMKTKGTSEKCRTPLIPLRYE